MTAFSLDQYQGCLLGLATGDAMGAPYEGGWPERLAWACLGRSMGGALRWTDDTQMSLDLAEIVLTCGRVDQDALAVQFARSYQWSRGYGPSTARVLRRIRRGQSWQVAAQAVHPGGSFGNGAAMRAPVLALFFVADFAQLQAGVQQASVVTHAHPLGVEGAWMVALATHQLLTGHHAGGVLEALRQAASESVFMGHMEVITRWLSQGQPMPPQQVAVTLGNGMTAQTSCMSAVYAALAHMDESFEALMRYVIAMRGDVDTMAAMAGALWGVRNGAQRLPAIHLEQRDRLERVAQALYQHAAPASV